MRLQTRPARIWILALIALAFALPGPSRAVAQVPETDYEGATALGLSLRQLGTSKRVLMIAAHPDDETTQVLSSLALGEGAAVAYLSLTRGEGGQNGIGLEMQEGLGLLRTEELLAARRLDGAAQYFTRAVDWGFSKNADEAFGHWPREELLRDVVAVVRHFRPDVIVSVFSGTPRDGHGQHQAAGVIARDAFDAAPDATRFPDLAAAGLRPHAPIHLFQVVRSVEEARAASLAAGRFDPLLGQSYFQVAMASRSRHRSQDMGRPLTPGPQPIHLSLAKSRGDPARASGLFAGVDTTLLARAARSTTFANDGSGQVEGLLARYEEIVERVRSDFNPLLPDRLLPSMLDLRRTLDATMAAARSPGDEELRYHLDQERLRVDEALRRAARLTVSAVSEEEVVVPGQTFGLDLFVWNGGSEAVTVTRLEPALPPGWVATAVEPGAEEAIGAGSLLKRAFRVTVPPDAPASEPYFLRLPRRGARYAWPANAGPVGLPFQPDEVSASAVVRVRDVDLPVRTTAVFQDVDLKKGQFERPVRVVPAVALTVEPGLAMLPLVRSGEPVRVAVRLVAEEPEGISGTLRLRAPDGWRVEPSEVALRFAPGGEQRTLEFAVHAPASLSPGSVSFDALFEDDRGGIFDRGFHLVDYEHIRPRPLFRQATVDVHVVDVEVPEGLRVGYIAGPGDDIPAMLAGIGVRTELLGPAELAAAPLEPFDVIVVGIRAYDGRPDLVTHNQRLLEYVRGGGTVVVQYNRYEFLAPGLAPYPLEMARPHDRVTDQNAEVHVLQPDHPVFTTPNLITAADFDGWVQERGLYFLSRWDDRYTPLLEMADPGEDPNRGSLMFARHGEGQYVYTGLALFRQLPAGVPGAYRLFANLLALGAAR